MIELAMDPRLEQQVKLPKYNGTTCALSAHSDLDKAKCLRKVWPELTKEGARNFAQQHLEFARVCGKKYSETLEEAAQLTWGREYSITDYKISGIASDEFPEQFKNHLRKLVRLAQDHSSASLAFLRYAR